MWTAAAVPGPAQDPPPVGYVSKDRVVELAQAADPSIAAFVPAAAAVTSFAALVDPVHIRVFFCAARPADLKLAAAIGLATAAAANPALTVELIAVAENLSEPAALISENSVTKAPEVIVFWMNQEIARVHPDPASGVETDLADLIFQVRTQIAQDMVLDHDFFKFTYHKDLLSLDCKRCHGPAGRERTLGRNDQKGRGATRAALLGNI
jgi:hypothetical protein